MPDALGVARISDRIEVTQSASPASAASHPGRRGGPAGRPEPMLSAGGAAAGRWGQMRPPIPTEPLHTTNADM